jgi:hypothetical protein
MFGTALSGAPRRMVTQNSRFRRLPRGRSESRAQLSADPCRYVWYMDLHRPDPFRDRPRSADDLVLSDAAIDALLGDLHRIGSLLRPDEEADPAWLDELERAVHEHWDDTIDETWELGRD